MKKTTVKKVAAPRVAKIAVSEANVAKAAARLLGVKLVTPEIAYVQRVLGATASQEALDERVIAVRRMPWAEFALPD